jgi:signal peptidase I
MQMRMVKEEPEVLVPETVVGQAPADRRDYFRLAGSIFKQILALLVAAVMAFGCFHLSQRYVVQAVQVAGNSMSPTLADANWYLLNRLVYRFREPRPGDIVVLSDPQVPGFAIKRIVARPGDGVYVKGGDIYVNGELLDEPYLEPRTHTFSDPDYAAQFWVCGEGHYFVLGDNRNNSTDSRIYGTVPFHSILGVVLY